MELLFYWGLKILFWVGLAFAAWFALVALVGFTVGLIDNIWCSIQYHNIDINDYVQKDNKF